jgi:GT2 family glycosyltransferase
VPNPAVDVVVVSYNSGDELRGCVEDLSRAPRMAVHVVDNASADESLEVVRDLPVRAVALTRNGGFGHGCNVGWRGGAAPYVLFLNPDARISPQAVDALRVVLDEDDSVGACAPRTLEPDGSLQHCQRRFPSLRSTFARALFLHRLAPGAAWSDEVVRSDAEYAQRAFPDWISGACMLVRRDLLERLGGFDERFFMYSEDADLCRRIRDAGYRVAYEPGATATHVGGASAPRASLLPLLAASRLLYARKHSGRAAMLLERAGLGLEAALRIVAGRGGRDARAGQLRTLLLVVGVRGLADAPVARRTEP